MRKNKKIKTLKSLKAALKKLKCSGKKIVFTNGCFDILHKGHICYLKKAKALGDILVVGLNSDASVRRLKGKKRPVNRQADRAALLSELKSVDYIVIFSQDTPFKLIKDVRPDVLVKGADWKAKDIVGGRFVKSCGGAVKTVSFLKGYSTTNLIKRLGNAE